MSRAVLFHGVLAHGRSDIFILVKWRGCELAVYTELHTGAMGEWDCADAVAVAGGVRKPGPSRRRAKGLKQQAK